MQCTRYFPMHYPTNDLIIGSNGFSSHIFNDNVEFGEVPPSSMDQYLVYDKEVFRQLIQNHEATFRHQVRELHRLYQRQRELIDDMRVRQIFTQHLLSDTVPCSSQALPDVSQTTSHNMSWLLGDHKLSVLTADQIQQPPAFIAKNIPEPAKSCSGPLIRQNSCHKIESTSSRSKGVGKRFLNREEPANDYPDDDASDSVIGSDSNSRKSCILIDLNEPVQLESSHMEIMNNDQCLSGLLNSTTGPGGKNSSVAIDLNYLPDSCVSETGLDEKKSKIKAEIDLNTSVVIDEPFPSTNTIDFAGPVSPENNECTPPRGESEDIQIEMPPFSSDIVAAQTLVMISISQNSLFWFAEIVSSIGDDLENKITKLDNLSTNNRQNELVPDGIGNSCKENAVNLSCVFRQENETGTLSGKSRKGTLKRNACKKACPKRKKHLKLSTSNVVKKAVNSALKMPVILSWGKIKKRRGNQRRKASKNVFLFVS